jgi:hypothetical protein
VADGQERDAALPFGESRRTTAKNNGEEQRRRENQRRERLSP